MGLKQVLQTAVTVGEYPFEKLEKLRKAFRSVSRDVITAFQDNIEKLRKIV